MAAGIARKTIATMSALRLFILFLYCEYGHKGKGKKRNRGKLNPFYDYRVFYGLFIFYILMSGEK